MPSETTTLLITAIVVGAITGLAAVLLFKMIGWVSWVSFVKLPELAPWLGRGWLLVIPALGGLISGILVYFAAPQAKGSGIPAVMESLALYGGRIRPIIAPVKILATSLTIGTGGSAGREGPIVQIGSTIGSVTGLLLPVGPTRPQPGGVPGPSGCASSTPPSPASLSLSKCSWANRVWAC